MSISFIFFNFCLGLAHVMSHKEHDNYIEPAVFQEKNNPVCDKFKVGPEMFEEKLFANQCRKNAENR